MWHIRLQALEESRLIEPEEAEQLRQHHMRHAPDLLRIRQIELDVATLKEQIAYIKDGVQYGQEPEPAPQAGNTDSAARPATDGKADKKEDTKAKGGLFSRLWNGLRDNLGKALRRLADILAPLKQIIRSEPTPTFKHKPVDVSIQALEQQLAGLQQERQALADRLVPYPHPDGPQQVPLDYSDERLKQLYQEKRFEVAQGPDREFLDKTFSEVYGEWLSKFGKYTSDFQNAEASNVFFSRLHKLLERTQSQEDYNRFEMQAGGKPLEYLPNERDRKDAHGHPIPQMTYAQWKFNYVWSMFTGDKGQHSIRDSLYELSQIGDRQIQQALYESTKPWLEEIMHRVIDNLPAAFTFKPNGARFPGTTGNEEAMQKDYLGRPTVKQGGQDVWWVNAEAAHRGIHREFQMVNGDRQLAAIVAENKQTVARRAA